MRHTALALLLLLTAMAAFAAGHDETARAALPILGELAKRSPSTATIGRDEVRNATVDSGIRIMEVGLRDLRAYQGGDPRRLLIDSGRTIHAVRVGGMLKSAITVSETGSGPRAVEFGRTILVQRFERTRGPARGGEFLVHVLALNSWFMARESDGKLTFTPMHDIAGLKEGTAIDAATALGELAKMAQRIGDDDLT
jgi:hypothetical protein